MQRKSALCDGFPGPIQSVSRCEAPCSQSGGREGWNGENGLHNFGPSVTSPRRSFIICWTMSLHGLVQVGDGWVLAMSSERSVTAFLRCIYFRNVAQAPQRPIRRAVTATKRPCAIAKERGQATPRALGQSRSRVRGENVASWHRRRPHLHDGANRIGLAYSATVFRRFGQGVCCGRHARPSRPKPQRGVSRLELSLFGGLCCTGRSTRHLRIGPHSMRCQFPDPRTVLPESTLPNAASRARSRAFWHFRSRGS
jgi:hypothetical protein